MTLDLDALAALEKKATPGPWEWDGRTEEDDGYVYIPQGAFLGDTLVMLSDTYEGCRYDCDLLAAARNALPELIRLARIGQRVERDAKP